MNLETAKQEAKVARGCETPTQLGQAALVLLDHIAELKARAEKAEDLADTEAERHLIRIAELEAENREQHAKLTKACVDSGYGICARCGDVIDPTQGATR